MRVRNPDAAVVVEASSTAGSVLRLAQIRQMFLQRWLLALDSYYNAVELIGAGVDPESRTPFRSEKKDAVVGAAVAALISGWQGAFGSAFQSAYHEGRALWSGATVRAQMSGAAQAALTRQNFFAFRFALDVAQHRPDEPGRWGAGARASLYGDALEGAYQQGAVDGAPEDAPIWWRLSACKHCNDCPTIAIGSPYTRATLPTVPRGGHTQCRSRCKCWLEFGTPRTTGATAPPRPALRDRVSTTGPGPGRPPTAAERARIDHLDRRVDYAARAAFRLDAAGAQAEAGGVSALRDRWQAELEEYVSTRGIVYQQTYGGAAVLDRYNVSRQDLDILVGRDGVSASTVALLGIASIAKMLGDDRDRGQADVTEALVSSPAESPMRTAINAVGNGALESERAQLDALYAARSTKTVRVGPFDDDWRTFCHRAGFFITGETSEVLSVVRALGGKVEVAPCAW